MVSTNRGVRVENKNRQVVIRKRKEKRPKGKKGTQIPLRPCTEEEPRERKTLRGCTSVWRFQGNKYRTERK